MTDQFEQDLAAIRKRFAALMKAKYPRKLGKLAQLLKVSPSLLSHWCKGNSQPNLLDLLKLAHALDLPVDELVRVRQPDGDPSYRLAAEQAQRFNSEYMKVSREATARHRAVLRVADFLGRQIVAHIEDEVAKLEQVDDFLPGVFREEDHLRLEPFSLETCLYLYDLAGDVDVRTRGNSAFTDIVRENIKAAYSYRMLLASDMPGGEKAAQDTAKALRAVLGRGCTASQIETHCAIRVTKAKFISGCVLYQLDRAKLGASELATMGVRHAECIDDENWIGFMKATYETSHVDIIMDHRHLARSRRTFDALWDNAKKL